MWPMILLGAIQAGSSIFQGITAGQAGQQNAEVLEQQAQIRRDEGELTRRSLFDRARRIGVQGEAFVGSQRAGFASSGVSTTKGSPLAVMRESQRSIQQDISRTRQLGESAFTLGLREGEVIQQQADITRQFGAQQAFAGAIGGAGSFLGSLASNPDFFQNLWAV